MELKKLFAETETQSAACKKLINAVIDEQSFVETDVLLRTETALGTAVGEGVVGGFAAIDGLRTVIFATNPDVLKGSIGRKAADKIVRLVNNAVKTGAPVVAIIDSQGARFAEGTEAVSGYSSILKAFAEAYGEVPVIIVNKGSNFGMLSYLSAYCDCCIAYDKSVMASASPLVLAAKSGVGVEEIGTTAVHVATGLYSFVVKSDKELKAGISSILDYLSNPECESTDDPNRVAKKASDMSGIIAETFDKKTFHEVKAGFGKEVITGFARLNGMAVGVVAGNAAVDDGRLTGEGAVKVTDLLVTCASFGLPVVNLVDCAGSALDLKKENTNLIREIGNMLCAYHSLDVAKVAVVTGKAIGLGFAAFADRSVCDYTAAWNTASIGAVESTAAANLLYAQDIASAKNKEKAEAQYAEKYADENLSAAVSAANGYIDNVIDPTFTRQYLIQAVSAFSKE